MSQFPQEASVQPGTVLCYTITNLIHYASPMCTLYSRAASCHTFNLGSNDNFKYQLEENATIVPYLTTSLRLQPNTTQIKTAVASQYIMVQAILQSCFWGSGYVANILTLLFFKLCIHLIVPSRRICTAKLRAFVQLLSGGTVFHALTTDKEDNVLNLTHAFSQ